MNNAIRIRNKKPDYTHDITKYTLTDLSKKELVMILQNREYEKHSRQHTNIFFGCMIASFILAIGLSRYHNLAVGSACFIPIVVYFVLNHRRSQRIKKSVEDQLHDTKEDEPNEPIRG